MILTKFVGTLFIIAMSSGPPPVVAAANVNEIAGGEDAHQYLRHEPSGDRELAQKITHPALCTKRCVTNCFGKANPGKCADSFMANKCYPFATATKALVKKNCLASIACRGGRRCPDKSCAKSGTCCPNETKCPNGACVGAGQCCSGQTLCDDKRTCVAAGVCCPDEKKCVDGTCVKLTESCGQVLYCSDGTPRPVNGCCSDERQCDGDLTCIASDTCCSDEVTCPDGRCAASAQLCGFCGDGTCDSTQGETIANCRVDCLTEARCGDGLCDSFLGETASTCGYDCGVLPAGCGDSVCNTTMGESALTCRWDCFKGPAQCGDGYCDVRLGETETNCPTDCYQGQMVETFLAQAELAGLLRSDLELFPPTAILQVLQDSPFGFLPGTPLVTSDNVVEGTNFSFVANNDSTLVLRGTFVPESGNVPAGTIVRAYSSYDTLHATLAEGPVDATGAYSLLITDLQPGLTPILVTFTGPPPASVPTRRNLPVGQSTRLNEASPKLVWCVNNQQCPPPLTIKLTWTGHSDVDLHVVEPSGNQVYYRARSGDVGYLDYDNVEGFGPEHYYYTAQPPRTDSHFEVFVHLFSARDVETYTLQVFESGKQVSLYSGVLTYTGQASERFAVILPGTDSGDVCSVCASNQGNARSLEVRDYRKVPEVCSCLEVFDYMHNADWWCHTFDWCDEEDLKLTDKYVAYRALVQLPARKVNVKAAIYTVIGTMISGTPGLQGPVDVAMDKMSSPTYNYLCAKSYLLEAYCANENAYQLFAGVKESLKLLESVEKLKLLGGKESVQDALNFMAVEAGEIAFKGFMKYEELRKIVVTFAFHIQNDCSRG